MDLLFKPVARVIFAMRKEDCAGLHLAYKIKQVLAVGVSREIEILDMAAAGDLSGTRAENKVLTGFGCAEPTTGRIGVGVADEEN